MTERFWLSLYAACNTCHHPRHMHVAAVACEVKACTCPTFVPEART
jgi:hypothetical protein